MTPPVEKERAYALFEKAWKDQRLVDDGPLYKEIAEWFWKRGWQASRAELSKGEQSADVRPLARELGWPKGGSHAAEGSGFQCKCGCVVQFIYPGEQCYICFASERITQYTQRALAEQREENRLLKAVIDERDAQMQFMTDENQRLRDSQLQVALVCASCRKDLGLEDEGDAKQGQCVNCKKWAVCDVVHMIVGSALSPTNGRTP